MKKGLLVLILLLLLTTTTGCKKSVIGKWKSADDDDYFYTFNRDKTCSYEMSVAKSNCTYEEEDSYLTILYDGNSNSNKYEYKIEKNTLIIIDDFGKEYKFIKQ